ncbi:hypothetical protein BSL78_08409 [Apostichopus japonicus]|uniref:ZU5 domain-containing protein n=1 Tax=Stichopus japonicus TaxID=307972 RepID=A0A2G8L371_STIJA|nr:hypothetical protein BSL78_08409 [Apostichopus japonicus]
MDIRIPGRMSAKSSSLKPISEATNTTVEQQEDKGNDVPSKRNMEFRLPGRMSAKSSSLKPISDNLPSNPLQMELLINKDGGVLELPDTGVSLEIPPGALEKDQLIQMRIIPYNFQGDSDLSFSSNSSVVVELLPSNLKLLKPVKLTLPHCLVLKKGCEWKAKIYSSHHEEGTHPLWEPQPDTPYLLNQGNCIIELRTFSWEKFVIDNEVVEGKRIVLYAAKHLPSHKAIVHIDVGFYLDLVGGEEEIPFIRAAISIGSFCTFAFNKKGTMETDKFSCYFKAGQENLTDLTVVLEDVSVAASSLSDSSVPSKSGNVPHSEKRCMDKSTAEVKNVPMMESMLKETT